MRRRAYKTLIMRENQAAKKNRKRTTKREAWKKKVYSLIKSITWHYTFTVTHFLIQKAKMTPNCPCESLKTSIQ